MNVQHLTDNATRIAKQVARHDATIVGSRLIGAVGCLYASYKAKQASEKLLDEAVEVIDRRFTKKRFERIVEDDDVKVKANA